MGSSGPKNVLIAEVEQDILQLVEEKLDLIVLNLMLPEMDKLKIGKQLRSLPYTTILPNASLAHTRRPSA